jgi:chromate reductase, NAD(P)H dehydrogenase (quinone)
MTEHVVILEPEDGTLGQSLTLLGFDVVRVQAVALAVGAMNGADGLVAAHGVSGRDLEQLRAACTVPRGVFVAPEKHPLTDFRSYWLRGLPLAVLAMSGSARKGSYNGKLLGLAADAVRAAGVPVTVLDMNETPLPLYHGGLEAGGALPDEVHAMQRVFFRHHGFLVAAPEYNGFPTPLLKNTLDWVSRSTGGAPGSSAFSGTVAGIVSAAGGGAGARVRPLVRLLLGNLRMDVVDAEAGIPKASAAFTPDDSLKDPADMAAVNEVAVQMVNALQKRFAGE